MKNSCSRLRESGCGHPCLLQLECHPGPCLHVKFQITTHQECYCPLKKVLAFSDAVESTLMSVPDATSLAEISVQLEEHLAARNMFARVCATVENVIDAKLETWLDVGVEKIQLQ